MPSMTAVCQGTLSPESLAGIRFIKTHNSREQSESMCACIERATDLERSSGHRFFLPNIERAKTSPELSSGGQYYMDCQICRRTIFEDGSGSATERGCD